MAVGKWKVLSLVKCSAQGVDGVREIVKTMNEDTAGRSSEKPAHKKSYGQMMAEMITGTDAQALRVADCIEKMLDTEPNSVERLDAKKELVKALLRK